MTEHADFGPDRNLPLPFEGGRSLPAHRPVLPQPYRADEDSISLAQYWRVLRRRKWLLAAFALTFVAVAGLQVFTVTPMYKATARLQIDPESSRIVPFQEVAGSEMAGGWFMEDYIWTQTENLRSQDSALRVVERLGLEHDESFNRSRNPGALLALRNALLGFARLPFDRQSSETRASDPGDDTKSTLARRLRARVEAQPVRNTRLIELSFTHPDPRLAAAIVNTLAEEFIEENLEGKYDATTRAGDFLRTQLEDLQIQVEQSEQELLAYAQRNNIVNLSERETIARKRLADLSDDLTAAETELIRYQSRAEAAQRAALDEFPEVLENAGILRLEQELSRARSELASFSSRYGPEWPAVKELRQEISDLEGQLQAERRRALLAARQDYELARDRQDRLSAAVEQQRQQVDELNESSIQYNILQREVDTNKELYEGLLQRLKEAGIAAGLRSSNIRLAESARAPQSRTSPRRSRTLLLSLLVGLFVGTGAVFVIEALDNTLKTGEDVSEHLGLPTLGVIPRLDGRRGLSRRPARRWRSARTPGRPRLLQKAEEVQQARALEAYRSLRTALLLSHSGNPPQVILVTSALAGEGKSTNAANIAVALAQTGSRTLIVDLDLRQPKLAEAFGLAAEQGMSTYLSGNSDLSSQIHESGIPNLFLVPAGPRAPNPAELIGSQRMSTGVQLMREYFTYVVIDSPPVLELSDALIASPHADGVILVARGNSTPRKTVQRSANVLMQLGAKLLGILVNDVEVDLAEYGYHGYAASYFDRYRQSDNESSQRSA